MHASPLFKRLQILNLYRGVCIIFQRSGNTNPKLRERGRILRNKFIVSLPNLTNIIKVGL